MLLGRGREGKGRVVEAQNALRRCAGVPNQFIAFEWGTLSGLCYFTKLRSYYY
jgi:hypothetical protein